MQVYHEADLLLFILSTDRPTKDPPVMSRLAAAAAAAAVTPFFISPAAAFINWPAGSEAMTCEFVPTARDSLSAPQIEIRGNCTSSSDEINGEKLHLFTVQTDVTNIAAARVARGGARLGWARRRLWMTSLQAGACCYCCCCCWYKHAIHKLAAARVSCFLRPSVSQPAVALTSLYKSAMVQQSTELAALILPLCRMLNY